MHTRRGAYRGKKQMNKFAFQNNARQSHLPASLAAASSLSCLWSARRHPLAPISRTSLHPSSRLPLSSSPPLPPSSAPSPPSRVVDAPWHPLSLSSGTTTRATPQPYFFHSVLSIDQVLNFRVHPSRASTSSSSASSTSSCFSCCWLLLRATPYVLFRFSSIYPRTLTLRYGVRRCHPFGPHPPVPPLCLIKRTH